MAARKKAEYVSKATVSTISVTSRAAVKFRDNYYTIEYHEERTFPADIKDVDMNKERAMLWDTCNTEVDKQVEDIFEMARKKSRW